MERFSFATFVVDDLNRAAFEQCRRTTDLSEEEAPSFLLVGEAGTGKTHLLYAVANRVRAESASAAVAYISPGHFPDEVKRIIEDPAPVDLAEHALLLVDGLEGFQEDAAALDGVLRIFMQNEHRVVLASSVHPGRLHWLPEGVQQAVASARLIPIERSLESSEAEAMERRIREDLEAKIQSQRSEIEVLRDRPSEPDDFAEASDGEPLEDALTALRNKVSAQSDEIEHLKAENALLRVSDEETAAPGPGVEDALDDGPRQTDATGASDSVAANLVQTRAEAEGLLKQAESCLHQIERSREDFADAQREHEQQLREIERLESIFAETPPEGQVALDASEQEHEIERLRAELERTRQAIGADDSDTGARLQSVLESLDPILGSMPVSHGADSDPDDGFERLRQAVVRLDRERNDRQARIEELESEVDTLRHRKDETTSVLEELRDELVAAHEGRQSADSARDAARSTAARIEAELYAHQTATRDGLDSIRAELQDQEKVFNEQLDDIRKTRELLMSELLKRSERLEEEQTELERLIDLLRSEVQPELKLPRPLAIAPSESVAQLKEAGDLIRAYDDEVSGDGPEVASGDDPEVVSGDSEDAPPAEQKKPDVAEAVDAQAPADPEKTIYRPDFGSGFRVVEPPAESDQDNEPESRAEGEGFNPRNRTA